MTVANETLLCRPQLRAIGTRIRVCLDRWIQPERNLARNCKEAKSDGEQVQFSVERPCRWKTIDMCEPIYLTVSIANKNLAPPNDCLGKVSPMMFTLFHSHLGFADFRCKSLNQISWTITHSGLHCYNHGYGLASLHWMALLLVILTFLAACHCIAG